MYSQLYFHPVRRIYDIHLKQFLQAWLKNGMFSIRPGDLLKVTDNEVTAAMLAAAFDPRKRISDNANANQWFESDAPVGDVISNLAYATVQARLAQLQGSRISALSLPEFRSLLESLANVSALNRRIRSGILPAVEDYKAVGAKLDPVAAKASTWPELRYMMAVIAERAKEHDRAAQLYRSVQSSRSTAGPALRSAIAKGEIATCIARVDRLRSPNGMFRDHKLDPVRALKAFQAAFDEVWPEYERVFGFTTPRPRISIIPEANAFWSPARNEILAGAMWSTIPDITYHEAAHPFLVRFIALDLLTAEADADAAEVVDDATSTFEKAGPAEPQPGEAAAVERAYAIALASWYRQKRAGQTAAQADWNLAVGGAAWVNDDRTLQELPMFSLREPGSAYPGDPQVADYQFVRKGEVLEPTAASGVGTKAFYELAMSSDTETALSLWLEALPKLGRSVSFPALASATIAAAEARKDPALVQSVRQAWLVVNVQP